MTTAAFNKDMIQEIESSLDPTHPLKNSHNLEILGYGEISTVFSLKSGDGSSWAMKRLPVYDSMEECEAYIETYKLYNGELKKLGLHIPDYDGIAAAGHKGIYTAYLIQKRLPGESVCHKVIHHLQDEDILILLENIVRDMLKIWNHNEHNPKHLIGLDGQISNWTIKDYKKDGFRVSDKTELYFIDTSTPFIRIDGKEQINARLLLKSAPKMLQPLLAALFLEDVVGRYYSLRDVIIDLLANLHKEQKPEIIPLAMRRINEYLRTHAQHLNMDFITLKDIDSYYKEDKFIWALYMSVRKIDRFIKTKLLRKRYEFILPGKIKR